MVMILNDSILCTHVYKESRFNMLLHTHTEHKRYLCELTDVITNLWYAFHRIYVCGSVVKNPLANAGGSGSISGLEKIPGEGVAPYSSILAGQSHGQRSLVGYSPRGHKDWT